ncbi:MAG: hypothetical protein M3336_07570 [Chloroflexota bacterium]|nr:hypothetical protein [Chloroflexota bacterium]
MLTRPAALARPAPRWASSELAWLSGAAVVLVVLCGLPYIVAALYGPAALERPGTFWFGHDFSQYQAAMREGGAQPGWLIHNHFTAEPHQPAFIYPVYVAAGKLAAALAVDAIAVFGALEWLGRLTLLASLYAFSATFLDDPRQRRLAVLLAAGTLGLMALVAPLRLALEALHAPWFSEHLPSTINVYLELNSFGVFLSAPHLLFGLALTLLVATLYLRRATGALAAAMLALSLSHPFNVPVLVCVLVAHAAWNGRQWWAPAAIAALAGAPMGVYNALLFSREPMWSATYGAQNAMPAPAPWALPTDFGLVLIAAPLAWRAVLGWPTERRRFALLWIGLGLAWLYAPVPYQRRFGFGLQPMLAVLAAVGLWQVSARLHSRAFNYAVVGAALATPMLVYMALLASAASNSPSEVYLWSRAEARAARWLSERTTADDVVLAATEFANPLAGAIDGRVVHGHVVATLASPTKQALVERFFAADTPSPEREALLAESRATVVAFGPRERALGATNLAAQAPLEQIYDRDGVQLFRVRR